MSGVNKGTPSTARSDKVGPWKLGETLGYGSTGKVQLAYNEVTKQPAAIKEISKAIFSAKTVTNNGSIVGTAPDALPYGIEREIIIMKLLNHPNVLRLYDVWETNPSLYMVLEYAEKGELFNLLVERGPLPENEAVCFFRQIIIGVSYCHALGIVHRDLKPENLLLDHDLNIKIADFGMAALETEDKLLETSCGSPHYAAPEIVSGIPYHGFASDIWSCGVIFFALLTGRLPFDEEDGNIRNLLLKVQSGKFEMPDNDEISPEAQDLLARILTVDPELRIKPREILKHPLLQKYPNLSDNKTIRNLPREDTYLHPLSECGSSEIDKNILQNLVVLWHGRPASEIAAKLNEPGASAEKTLYALLARFKNDTERETARQKQIRKKSSNNNNARGSVISNSNNLISPKKRNRRSTINASSSHKRSVSLIKLSGSNNSTSSSASVTPPKKISVNLSSNKRLSTVKTQGNGGSPTPAFRSKRISITDPDGSITVPPPVTMDMLKDIHKTPNGKRLSRTGVRLSFKPTNKRGSVTTKLISTYAKLSEDDDWEYIEKETKRTSSDFATLIDEIFEHEKFEQIRKEKAELERRVREQKAREERERKEREEKDLREKLELESRQRRELELLKAEEDDTVLHAPNASKNARSVSEPLERRKRNSLVNVQSDIEQIFGQRSISLQTRPVSRLDPGLFGTEKANEIGTLDSAAQERERLKTEKTILETIRRSKFLGSSFDIEKELRNDETRRIISQSLNGGAKNGDGSGLQPLPRKPAGAALNSSEPRKISDVSVPQFTRESKFSSDSNRRLSVLSLYSTKPSYRNLSGILNDSNSAGQFDSSLKPSGAQVKNEPEFQFEAVHTMPDENANSAYDDNGNSNSNVANVNSSTTQGDTAPGSSSLEEMTRDVSVRSDGRKDISSSKRNTKLNYADRFQDADSMIDNPDDIPYPKEVKLPALPPLKNADKVGGLGYYESSSESLRNNIETTPKSRVQNHFSSPERMTRDGSGEANSMKRPSMDESPKSSDGDSDIDPTKSSAGQDNLSSTSISDQRDSEVPHIPKQRPPQAHRGEGSTHKNATKKPVPLNASTSTNRRGDGLFNGSTMQKRTDGRVPLRDITTNTDKKRNMSFFKKLSKTIEKDIMRDVVNYEEEVATAVSAKQLFAGLQNLLRGWTQYGLKDVRSHPAKMTLTGKLASENIFSLRSTLFEVYVRPNGRASIVGFRKKSGSDKAMRRLVNEVEKVLMKEGVIRK